MMLFSVFMLFIVLICSCNSNQNNSRNTEIAIENNTKIQDNKNENINENQYEIIFLESFRENWDSINPTVSIYKLRNNKLMKITSYQLVR